MAPQPPTPNGPQGAQDLMPTKYQRVLLKLSGEALAGDQGSGLAWPVLDRFAYEIKTVLHLGLELAIVVGGGNIYRGKAGENYGINRVQGDYMGMLATVINALALQEALERHEVPVRVQSGVEIDRVCEPFIRRKAIRHLEKGRVVIFGGGTGLPFFTTDTTAVHRAIEMDADVLLKGTQVDGIYTADPKHDPNATKYDVLPYDEAIRHRLGVMDQTAFTLCQEHRLPVVVFNIHQPGSLMQVVQGAHVGTLVC